MTKDCPEKPLGANSSNGMELLFEFWMRAPNLMQRNFNWNRKCVHGERTSAGNEPFREHEGWRRGSPTDREFEGGRRVNVGKESSRSQHGNPSLKGVWIGKDRLFLGDKSGFEVAGRKYADTNLLRSQESMDSRNFVFNSKWEVNYLPMDQIGGGLVGGKGLGHDGSLGLIPVGLQESVKIDNSLPKKMNLGLDDVSQVTKSGTKRDEKIGPLVNSDPIYNPEKRLYKEKVLKSPNVSNVAELKRQKHGRSCSPPWFGGGSDALSRTMNKVTNSSQVEISFVRGSW
ncbi:hypothetical protein LWI29_025058 [Acer saccharum]|uniref:Uncharacterized protein n=1 Tax=Acer saccharum TaxID=4024 RepID=A0AA39SXL5_ACESA|nr:hypothetical protein LWI29_025058 [Acer saccharum]